jgi:hypothetical protein
LQERGIERAEAVFGHRSPAQAHPNATVQSPPSSRSAR